MRLSLSLLYDISTLYLLGFTKGYIGLNILLYLVKAPMKRSAVVIWWWWLPTRKIRGNPLVGLTSSYQLSWGT